MSLYVYKSGKITVFPCACIFLFAHLFSFSFLCVCVVFMFFCVYVSMSLWGFVGYSFFVYVCFYIDRYLYTCVLVGVAVHSSGKHNLSKFVCICVCE